MEIDLPEINTLLKIKFKLDQPIKQIISCKPRNALTYTPNLEILGNWSGVYLIEKDNKIVYVGTTDNLRSRLWNHHSKGNIVYFYPEDNASVRQMIEMIYKFKYIGKNNITGWTNAKTTTKPE